MRKNRFRKVLGTAMALTMAAGLMMSASAAEGEVVLSFTYPDDVPASDVSITVHSELPTYSSAGGAVGMAEFEMEDDGTYIIDEAGTYCYWVQGTDYYNVTKLFNVTEEDIANGTMTIEVATGPLGEGGFQASATAEYLAQNGMTVPSTDYAQWNRDFYMISWADELLESRFTTDTLAAGEDASNPYLDPDTFASPFFNQEEYGEMAMHQFTSQEQMMTFLEEKDEADEDMYLYNMAYTENYDYEIPLVIFSTSDLDDADTIQEAADIVTENGKLNLWIQTQIHPNEPASGEAGLVIIDMLTEEYGDDLLDNMNVIVIPRVNPEGSYLYDRYSYDLLDMNRDHMVLQNDETAVLHSHYVMFMPEVTIDGHEFTGYGITTSDGEYVMSNATDLLTTPASSINNNAELNALALDAVDAIHNDAQDNGLRVYHYGTTSVNAIGRAYYGLYGSISVLVETRGIGVGADYMDRRVYSQLSAYTSLMDYANENTQEIIDIVAAGRAEIVAEGATYNEDETFVLYQTASGDLQSPTPLDYVRYNMDGSEETIVQSVTLSMQDTAIHERSLPTAYVVPADMDHIDILLYILENQGIEYYELDAGSSATVQQYYYAGTFTYNNRNVGGYADLRDAAEVTFENGAIVIPMDQVAGNIAAALMEPDNLDSGSYYTSFAQYMTGEYDWTMYDAETMDYVYYRYTENDVRNTLVSNASTISASVSIALDSIDVDAATSTFNVTVDNAEGIKALFATVEASGSFVIEGVNGFSVSDFDDGTYMLAYGEGNTDVFTGSDVLAAVITVTGADGATVAISDVVIASTEEQADAAISGDSASSESAYEMFYACDLNGDGTVDYSDIACIVPYYGYDLETMPELSKYDVNGLDGIGSDDYLMVYRYFAS